MAVAYDLVVMGGTQAGFTAAIAAAQLQARVAWVTERSPGQWAAWQQPIWAEAGRLAYQQQFLRQLSRVNTPTSNPPDDHIGVEQAMQWAEAIVAGLEEQASPAIAAGLGVDVILGGGQFVRSPRLEFQVEGRKLRSRTYLLAPAVDISVPPIPGLELTDYLTCQDFLAQRLAERVPTDLVILGGGGAAVVMAQALARLGGQITLLTRYHHLLPQADIEAALLVQAQLEAEGIRVLTQNDVQQITVSSSGKKVLETATGAIATEAILLATQTRPQLASLHLEAVGVKFSRSGVQVNRKLQTTNARIYACGGAIARPETLPQMANYEAGVALKNALFWPRWQVDYHCIPYGVCTDPAVAQVGLREAEARKRYGRAVQIFKQEDSVVAQAQIQGTTTGFCKLITRRKGQLLGACLVGPATSELMAVLTLALRKGLSVRDLADLVVVAPSLAELIPQTAALEQTQAWHHRQGRRDCLERFFNLRRNWSS